MKKLLAVRRKYPKLNKILPANACLAKDKMSMELCMQVFNKDVITLLKSIHKEDSVSEEGQVAGSSAEFFEYMENSYFLLYVFYSKSNFTEGGKWGKRQLTYSCGE
jgi:hypothetical protein